MLAGGFNPPVTAVAARAASDFAKFCQGGVFGFLRYQWEGG
jgi:hypothetical protein